MRNHIDLSIGHFYFIAGRDTKDVEKAILPTLLFVNANHPSFDELRAPGFMLCVGWWDFSIKFVWFFKSSKTAQ